MIEHPDTGPHPADDVLAAYLEGTLDGGERERMSAHLDRCDDCRNATASASATLAELDSGGSSFRWLGGLVAAAALVALTLVPASRLSNPTQVTPVLRSESIESTARFAALAPSDGAVASSRPTFRWASVEVDATYELTLSDEIGDVVWSGRTIETELTLPEEVTLDPGVYHWVVDALLADGRDATSGAHRFRVSG